MEYNYLPLAMGEPVEYLNRPRTVTESIVEGGTSTVIKKTYHAYPFSGMNRQEIKEQSVNNANYGNPGNLRTTRTYYASVAWDGMIKSIQYPDGRLDSYTYKTGTYTAAADAPGTFTEGSASTDTDRCKMVVHSTVANPTGIANKTTREEHVWNKYGNEVFYATTVCTESGTYDESNPIDWTVSVYDDLNHRTRTTYSDGTLETGYWGSTGCCGKDNGTDRSGIYTSYVYDDYKRVESFSRNAVVTTHNYDGKGRRLGTTRTGGSLTLTSSTVYDLTGRITSSTKENGLTILTDFNDAARTATTTLPGNGTRIVTKYADGRIKTISGTAVVPEYHEYGITAGKLWHKIYTGSTDATSPRWVKTTYDMLDRVKTVERPGFGANIVLKTLNIYNTKGQLWKTEQYSNQDLLSRTINQYDSLGNPFRQGLDVNHDGTLTLASTDRISESDTAYEKIGIDWFRTSKSIAYPDENSATPKTISITRTQLTGLGSTSTYGKLVAKTLSTDVYENTTISQTWVDRSSKTVTQAVNVSGSSVNQISITVNGVLISSTSTAAGDVTTFGYDALERRTKIYDPRTKGSDSANLHYSETHYNALGQVDYTKDAASHQTTYGYDSNTGRLVSVEDPENNTVHYAYNLRGQKIGEWGDTYPVIYKYDGYGQVTDLYTHRGSASDLVNTATEFNALLSGINATTGDSPDLDRTHWSYDSATGLILSKRYAYVASNSTASKGPDYTYYADGKLKTRKWARDAAGVVTMYTFYDNTGELKKIDYPGSATDDVVFTYDRLGRQKTIDDRQGIRTFGYTPEGQFDTEILKTDTGTILYEINQSQQLTPDGKGRNTGFALTIAGSSAQTITYGYDSYGRPKTVSSSIAATPNPLTAFVEYTYADHSDLIGGYTAGTAASTYPKLSVARNFEDQRNLIHSVVNGTITSQTATPTILSSFTYLNDDAGRRTDRTDIRAGATTVENDFEYNNRNELTSATMTDGTYTYAFDDIGNRNTSDEPNEAEITYAPNTLNQYKNDDNVAGAIDHGFDDDGNLTYDGTWYCKWNAENRLVEMKTYDEDTETPDSGDEKLEFKYDYNGRRYYKKASIHNGTGWSDTETTFIWNGNQIIHQTSSTEDDMGFVWGLGGQLLALQVTEGASVGTYFYAHDANKNVTDLVNASGTSVATYAYDAFGNPIGTPSSTIGTQNPFRFSNEYLDTETGFIAYKYRIYVPTLGRFLNRDPIEEQGDLNLYVFVGNNGIGKWDLLGQKKYIKKVSGKHLHSVSGTISAEITQKSCKDGGGIKITNIAWVEKPNDWGNIDYWDNGGALAVIAAFAGDIYISRGLGSLTKTFGGRLAGQMAWGGGFIGTIISEKLGYYFDLSAPVFEENKMRYSDCGKGKARKVFRLRIGFSYKVTYYSILVAGDNVFQGLTVNGKCCCKKDF